MQARFLLCAAMVWATLLPGASTLAQDNAVPSPPACTGANARPMTISAIAAAGTAVVGTCVSVEALVVGRQLYADNTARYRQRPRYNDPSSTGWQLGLYGNSLPDPQRARARIVGWVDSCDRMLQRAVAESDPNSIVMMGGYCHYFGGLVVNATAITALGEAGLVRIPRGRADPALGDLAPMAPGAARDGLLATASRLFAALDTPDVARALLRPSGGVARPDDEVTAMVDRLATGAGTRNGAGITEIFGWRVPAYATTEERRGYDEHAARVTEGIACHSTHPDAAALWPISEGDAMLGGQRPYACMRVTISANGTVTYEVSGTADEDYGIREP